MARFEKDRVVTLADLVTVKPGVVASLALTGDSTLFAVAEGESISEELYEGDMIYYVLSGQLAVVAGDERYELNDGEAIRVSARKEHRIEAGTSLKMVQTFVKEK